MNISITPGVYAISGCDQTKIYVGASINPEVRYNKQHLPELGRNCHYNQSLQDAWNSFGPNNFTLIILEPVADETQLPAREKEWLGKFKEQDALFNKTLSTTPGMRGKKHSSEARQKMSRSKTGNTYRKKNYAFISPSGEVIHAAGLRGICDQFGLNISHMSKVARGLLKQHKGWALAHLEADASAPESSESVENDVNP